MTPHKNTGNSFARKGETNLDSLIKFRVSKEDKAAFFKAANGMKLSAWILSILKTHI